MSAVQSSHTTSQHEQLLGDLTDAALRVAARHKVGGLSIDQELDFWHAITDANQKLLRVARTTCRTANDRVAALADAAYRAALGHGIPGSFTTFQLELWHAFRAVASAQPAGSQRLREPLNEEGGRARNTRPAPFFVTPVPQPTRRSAMSW